MASGPERKQDGSGEPRPAGHGIPPSASAALQAAGPDLLVACCVNAPPPPRAFAPPPHPCMRSQGAALPRREVSPDSESGVEPLPHSWQRGRGSHTPKTGCHPSLQSGRAEGRDEGGSTRAGGPGSFCDAPSPREPGLEPHDVAPGGVLPAHAWGANRAPAVRCDPPRRRRRRDLHAHARLRLRGVRAAHARGRVVYSACARPASSMCREPPARRAVTGARGRRCARHVLALRGLSAGRGEQTGRQAGDPRAPGEVSRAGPRAGPGGRRGRKSGGGGRFSEEAAPELCLEGGGASRTRRDGT